MNISPVRRLRHLSVAIFFALFVTALWVTPAFADGETPPPPDTGTTEVADDGSAAEATPVPTELAPTEETGSTEVAPTDEAIQPTEPAPTETVTDPAPVEGEISQSAPSEGETTGSDLLAELPEGTDLVVLDADGESVPLASEEASEIISGGDPFWCPSGVAPKPGEAPCTNSFPNLDALVVGFVPTSSGTIWFDNGGVAAGTIIDGAGLWSVAASYSLTLQGGWGGTSGSTALDPVDPYTYFSGVNDDYLWIQNWVGSVTLKNIVINADNTYNLASQDYALYVETKGNIVLNKVEVNNAINNNGGYETPGAFLDNTSGAGSITVSNSSFKNNEGDGLIAISNGTITLKNVYAYSNDGRGALLDNSGPTSKALTVSNSEFSGNGTDGLKVFSEGTVTLNNIVASSNGQSGAEIQNNNIGFEPVYVNGMNQFNYNGDDGLFVESYGPIKVSKTTAIDNDGNGVALENSNTTALQPVTISGYLTAMYNDADGLNINSNGNVTAAYLTINSNLGYGASIESFGGVSGVPKSIILTGKNIFNGNAGIGLEINSTGTITVYNMTALYNGLGGGDEIGVALDNSNNAAKQYPVSVLGTNLITNNSSMGMVILSYGVVTLSNVTAVGNGLGVPDAAGSGVFVNNSGGTYPKGVYIKGTNVFNLSDNTGLIVYSDGTISVANITAANNGTVGATLDNDNSLTAQSNVAISGYGLFEFNGASGGDQIGLKVNSHGAVTLNNIIARNNYGNGVFVFTLGLTTVHPVTLNGTNTFISNGLSGAGSGLEVWADGTIKVNNLTANTNFTYGAYLDNYTNWALNSFASFGSVLVTGFGSTMGNSNGTGLYIITHGSVTLNRITANSNFIGMVIYAGGNVTLVCSAAWSNFFMGVRIDTPLQITLKGLVSYGSFDDENFTSYTTLVRSTCP
jgi:hypothetical protein